MSTIEGVETARFWTTVKVLRVLKEEGRLTTTAVLRRVHARRSEVEAVLHDLYADRVISRSLGLARYGATTWKLRSP